MSKKTILVATTMLTLLAGCNKAATNNAANKAAPTANTAAAAPAPSATPAPAPAAGGDAVDAAFLTAHPWGMLGACASTTTLAADGTYTESDGATGTWSLSGNTLTTTKTGGSPETATVRKAGPNFVMSVGSEEVEMTPCPAT